MGGYSLRAVNLAGTRLSVSTSVTLFVIDPDRMLKPLGELGVT